MTVFGCKVQPHDPWLRYAVIPKLNGFCIYYKAGVDCPINGYFPFRTTCDGRTNKACEKEINSDRARTIN